MLVCEVLSGIVFCGHSAERMCCVCGLRAAIYLFRHTSYPSPEHAASSRACNEYLSRRSDPCHFVKQALHDRNLPQAESK
jgi:hypothetical protein